MKFNGFDHGQDQAKFLATIISELRQIADGLESGQKRLNEVQINAGITDATELGDCYRKLEATSHRRFTVAYCDAAETVPESALENWGGERNR